MIMLEFYVMNSVATRGDTVNQVCVCVCFLHLGQAGLFT